MVKGRRMKDQLRTMSMTPEERSCLESLDAAVRSQEVREQVCPIMERVRAKLAANQKALMAWEPIPLNVRASLTSSHSLCLGIHSAHGCRDRR